MACTLSVIVPVYNSAPYLHACVDSILSQSYTDIELLLVDDGSTDGSGAICDQLAKQNSRVFVFHKENGGVSSARNLGMRQAKGEWVSFVDADDVVLEDGLKFLASGTSEDVDMVWGGYEVFDERGEKTYAIPDRISEYLTNKEGLEMLFRPRYYRYLGFSVGRLFRRAVLCSLGICFDEDIAYNEDRLFCVRFMCASNAGIRFITTPVYGYIERQNSAMGLLKRSFQPAFITDLTAMIRMRRVIYDNYQRGESVRELVDSACYASWRRIAGMKGYSDLGLGTKAGVLIKLITGLGFRRFVGYDWSRNKNRLRKFIKKYL